MSKNLENALIYLIQNEEYYAHFVQQMKIEITTRMPTAAISCKDDISLIINPHFLDQFSIVHAAGILKHEVLHLMNEHIPRAINHGMDLKNNHHLFNVAADLAINQIIPNLPLEFKIFDKDGNVVSEDGKPITYEGMKGQFPNIKPNETMEYYWNHFKEHAPKQYVFGQNGEGEPLDDHSQWGEGGTEEQIAEKVKEIANKALEKCEKPGNVSGDIKQLLEKLNLKTKNWKKELRQFVARALNAIVEPTRKKRNRRYGTIYPGYKTEPSLVLAVAIDTSGSVSDDELTQFYAEIGKIHENKVQCIIIEADHDVQAIYEYNPKAKIEVKGRGGTRYNPAILKAMEMNVDGLIYFGDMEIFGEELTKPKFPVMWAMTEGAEKPADWGSSTIVKVNK